MKNLQPRFNRQDVRVLEQANLYEGFFKMDRLRLSHRLYQGGWSEPVERELFIRSDAVNVLLYDPWRDCVALVEQFRIGALAEDSPWMLEPVAGIVEAGETPEGVAIREAEEEAGAKILALEPIHHYHVSPGGSQEKVHLFCGKVDSTGLGGYHGLAEENEDICLQVMSREEALQAMSEGLTNNAAALLSLQWLQMNWAKLQEEWC